MSSRIKRYIIKFLNISEKEISSLEKIKNYNNVTIHTTNSISINTIFNVNELLNKLIIDINVGCRNFCNILIGSDATLIIHKGVYFNNYCSINCLGYIEIGENTLFGEGVKLYDHNHTYSYQNKTLIVEKADFKIGSIKIGENCWIGSNVCILNNVEIGDNVIIGANCLIYKSIPANSIVKHSEQLIITQN